MRLTSKIALGTAAVFFFVLFWGRYIALHQPVTISMRFDAKSQVLKIDLRNDSDDSIGFYDSLSFPQAGPEYLANVPRSLCAKIFSKTGELLSRGGMPPGCISVLNWESTVTSSFARHPMSALLPRQTVTSQITLKELISREIELTALKDFCVQFIVHVYFDPYLQYPVTKESEVSCVSSPVGMK